MKNLQLVIVFKNVYIFKLTHNHDEIIFIKNNVILNSIAIYNLEFKKPKTQGFISGEKYFLN